MEPAKLYMHEQAIRIAKMDIDHIVDALLNVGRAGSTYRNRVCIKPVAEDREIMWRKVPKYIDIPVKQAQIQALGINIMEPAELALGNNMAQCLNCFVIEKCIPNHQNPVPLPRQRDQVFNLVHLDRQRFLHEDVLICQQRLAGQRVVRMDWRGYEYSVNITLKYSGNILRKPGITILGLRLLQPFGFLVSNKCQNALW